MKDGYITFSRLGAHGRFCNQAFQIAGVLGIGRLNNLEPVFPTWRNIDHRDRFGHDEDIDIHAHLVHELPKVPEGLTFKEHNVEWGFHNVRLASGNWDLIGHFQSAKYFTHCLDTVQHYLRFKNEPEQNDYIAIHWRGGDYDEVWHPRLKMDYYAPAMAEFPGAKFLVFSDDLGKAREMFGSQVEYAAGNYIQDFKQMKKCKGFIIGNSSYSLMAAILGEHPEKRVVAPFPWFGPNFHPSQVANRDIYNDDWTVIDYRQAA